MLVRRLSDLGRHLGRQLNHLSSRIKRWCPWLSPRSRRDCAPLSARPLVLGLWVVLVTVGAALVLPMAPARACQQVEQFSGATAPVSLAHRQLLSGETLEGRLLPAIAARLDTDTARIQVIDTRAIVWANGCLGLMETDQICTQALVGGIAIAVAHGGKSHQFHASDDRLWPVASLTGHTDRVCRLAAPGPLASGNG